MILACISDRVLLASAIFRGLRRKVTKHLLHSLVEFLDVLVRVVGEGVARRASPQELSGLCVEQVDDQCAYLISICGRGCLSEISKASPPPASSEPVVERGQG